MSTIYPLCDLFEVDAVRYVVLRFPAFQEDRDVMLRERGIRGVDLTRISSRKEGIVFTLLS